MQSVSPFSNSKQPRHVAFDAPTLHAEQAGSFDAALQRTEHDESHARADDSSSDCDCCCDDEVSLRLEDLESEHESSQPTWENFATFHESRRGGLGPALEIALNQSSSFNMSLHMSSSSSMNDSLYPTKPPAVGNGDSSCCSLAIAVDDDETSVTMQCDEDEGLDLSERPLTATCLSRC
jgi:hypothetical protein